ncbi:MAG: flagellar basal body protein FliL [Alphaproteobacteria bacterium]|nr:flagellar basal body protein FliL [Alphaproteobacteria bacterium]
MVKLNFWKKKKKPDAEADADAEGADAPEPEKRDAEAGEEEGAEGGEVKKKKKLSGKNLVLFIILPAVLVLGAGGGAAFFLLKGGGPPAAHAEADAGHGKEKAKGKGKAKGGHGAGGEEGEGGVQVTEGDGVLFVAMPDILVNISSADGRPAYLKLKLTIEAPDEATVEALQPQLPRVTDQFNAFLRELRTDDLAGSAGAYRLRLELLRRVNLVVAPARVNAVLIEEMLVQ